MRPQLRTRAAGAILLAMSLAALVMSLVEGARRERFIECQVRVNDALIATLADARTVAHTERVTEDGVYRAVRDNPRQYREAIDDYFAARTAADEARRNAPLPEPPSQRCR